MFTKSMAFRVVLGLAVLTVVLGACGSPTTPAPTAEPPAEEQPAAGGAAALKITGAVESEMGWTEEELKAMTTLDVEMENSDGQKETYTGVAIVDLLALAKPKSDATTLVLVADDGYSAELPLADVQACPTCIVSFRSQGGLTSRMPGFAKNTSVKGLVEIQIK